MKGYGAYDIRGLYPQEVNEELAYNAGRAIPQFLKAKKIVVGRDCRTSSPSLAKTLIYALTDQGCNVIDTGYCNTPMSYYIAQKYHSLMITASHNPKEYNGIKITRKGVEGIGEHNGLKEIEKIANSCHFKEPQKRGRVTAKNFLKNYVQEVRKIVNGRYKPIKVLIDCGNGMAGYVVPELLKGLPIKYKLLYGELDGTYPNHTPNPVIPENTKDLQKEVVKGKYDLGIAYDSDCDRVFFVDEKGNRVRPEHILVLFAQHLLKKGENAVYTVNMSRIVREKIEEISGKARPSPIGHTEIPIVMKKWKGILGGEITGHFYFKKFKYADSGDIAALMMLALLSKTGKKISQLIKPLQKYATSEEINYKVNDKQGAMKRVEREYFRQIEHKIDGLSIDAGDHWFNVRLSKTENYVRLNCEAKNDKILNQAIQKIGRIINGKTN